MIQVLQVAGAVTVLAAFAAAQAGRLDGKSIIYLVLNAVGAGVLSVVALLDHDWGFLLLEGVWTVVSIISLGRVLSVPRRPDVR